MSNIARLVAMRFIDELMAGADKSCKPYREDGCVLSGSGDYRYKKGKSKNECREK